MIGGTGRRPRPALSLLVGLLALAASESPANSAQGDGGGAAGAVNVTVEVLAPRYSRLAEDLRRELGASGFLVVAREATSSEWRAEVRRLPATESHHHGVVVRADERMMTVFTRGGAPESIQSRFDQPVEPGDRMGRRRACLGVVEYLRVLSRAEAAVPPAPDQPVPGPGAGATSAQPSTTERKKADVAGPSQSGETSPTFGQDGQDGQDGSDRPLAAGSESWQLGVGSRLGLEAAPGGPTGHLLFLWYLPLDWGLGLCARAMWPVVGGQFRSGGNDVRTWAFGGAFSLQYQFKVGTSRLRPYLGAEGGLRVALTEATPANAWQSRESFTPGVTVGAEGGVRYALRPPIQLFLELGLGRGWLIPGVHRVDFETAAANANSLHASFGALFEI
ncbi:MAG: hypothetical protein ABJA82_06755 [Myxococcales bacterium]